MVEKYQGTQEMRSKEQGGDGRQKSTKNQTTRTHTRLLAHTAPTACDIVFITHRSSKDHPEEMVEKYDGTQEEGSKQPARGRRTSKNVQYQTPETPTGLLVLAAPSAYDIVFITQTINGLPCRNGRDI